MEKFIQTNLIPPKKAKAFQDSVWVTFLIDSTGNLSNFKIYNTKKEKDLNRPNNRVPAKANNKFENAALEVMKKMPKWIPANENGKAISQKMIIEIVYKKEH